MVKSIGCPSSITRLFNMDWRVNNIKKDGHMLLNLTVYREASILSLIKQRLYLQVYWYKSLTILKSISTELGWVKCDNNRFLPFTLQNLLFVCP